MKEKNKRAKKKAQREGKGGKREEDGIILAKEKKG